MGSIRHTLGDELGDTSSQKCENHREMSCGAAEKISTPALPIGTADSSRSGSKKFMAVFSSLTMSCKHEEEENAKYTRKLLMLNGASTCRNCFPKLYPKIRKVCVQSPPHHTRSRRRDTAAPSDSARVANEGRRRRRLARNETRVISKSKYQM